MKVNNVSRNAPAGRSRPSQKPSSATKSFAEQLTSRATAGPSGVSATGGLVSLDSILSVQGVDAPGDEGRRGGRRHAEDLLDQLDTLLAAILSGSVPRSALDALVDGLRRTRDQAGDPALEGVIREIELRVAVEIAKLQRG